MARVKSQDTKPEMVVRRAIHAAGLRYRLHVKDLPGKPDLVFPRYRVALFVHGCFWHGHRCDKFRMPSSNTEYWENKIRRNIERDEENCTMLMKLGWKPIVLWECDLQSGIEKFITLIRNLQGSLIKNCVAEAGDANSTAHRGNSLDRGL